MNSNTLKHFSCHVWMLALALCSCTSSVPRGEAVHYVRLDGAARMDTELAVSDLADEIEYVPLETREDLLVGVAPSVTVTSRWILVDDLSESGELLVFDRQGHFVSKIGSRDDAHYLPYFYHWQQLWCFDEQADRLYLLDLYGSVLTFDIHGDLLGRVPPAAAVEQCAHQSVLFDDSAIWVYNPCSELGSDRVAAYARNDGRRLWGFASDDVRLPPGHSAAIFSMDESRRHFGTRDMGLWLAADGTATVYPFRYPALYKQGASVRMKEYGNDTVFTLMPDGIPVPWMVFQGSERAGLKVDYLLEDARKVFFVCHEPFSLLDGTRLERFAYCGLYDKRTRRTRLMEGIDLKDDVAHVIPFRVVGMNKKNEYYGWCTAQDILAVESDNPSPELQRLQRQLKEDDNPVVVIAK